MILIGDQHASREKWNRIYRSASSELPQACGVLTEHQYLLPRNGRAIDIACGLGGNALLLSSVGLNTTALDISDIGIDKLSQHAKTTKLEINTVVAAASEDYFVSNKNSFGLFDVITVANYLDRKLFSLFPEMLAPHGLLFYQTFVRDKCDVDFGPSNPEFLLESNELLTLTRSLQCRVFYDLGTVGQTDHGLRNQSCVVAQKGV